jgi:hypothetical protein
MTKKVITLIFSFLFFITVIGQENLLKDRERLTDFFDYLIDDIYITAGINRGGIFYSNYYQELKYKNGLQFAMNTYTPISDKAFLNGGIGFAHRGFLHQPRYEEERYDIDFTTNFLEIPIYVSYELPEFSRVDFRFYLGAQFNFLLYKNQNNSYPEGMLNNPNVFMYNTDRFKTFDAGFRFGVSAEYNDFILQFSSFSGVNNIYSSEQGMLNTFNIDIGYFFMRKIRKNK